MAKLIDKSIPKFLLVGVGNTLLSMVLMFLLEGLGYWPSTAIAYVAGAVMSFFLNRHFTFRSEETFLRSAVKFPFAHTKFHVQKYGDGYYAVGNEAPGRTVLSLARSEDGIHWEIVRRILDYSAYPPGDVGFQYPHFFREGNTLYLSVRAGFNGAKNYHDSNAVIFLKTEL